MTVPIDQWGRDHWSTLLYAETVCVDESGRPNINRMRCNPRSHRRYAHMGSSSPCSPTRLRYDEKLHGHDDWDCVQDMRDAGLLQYGEDDSGPFWLLTDFGWKVAGLARRHCARRGRFDDFAPIDGNARYVVTCWMERDNHRIYVSTDGSAGPYNPARNRAERAVFPTYEAAVKAKERWYRTSPLCIHDSFQWRVSNVADIDEPFHGEAEIPA